jgi:hypothetical protein
LDWLSRHLGYDIDTLSRAIDFTGKAPDTIPLIVNHRLLFGLVPSDYIHETSFDAGSAACTFFSIDFNAGTHAASKTGL